MNSPKFKLGDLPPKDRQINQPTEGWREDTLYLVEVSFGVSNPIHESYFKVGFVGPKGNPIGYSEIWNNTYDRPTSLGEAHYLNVKKILHRGLR